MLKRKGISNPELEKVLWKFCWSDFEGCVCDLDVGHDGLHKCAYPPCGCTWTSEQAKEWHEKLKEEYGT